MHKLRVRKLVLAGVGGDSHFVGLSVLRKGLVRAGFDVIFLGSQNSPEVICQHAKAADCVLVSNMDGHAKYYLADLKGIQREQNVDDRLWYLGGYPSLDDLDSTLAELDDLGFDTIIHGYISVREVVARLTSDLAGWPQVKRSRIEALPEHPPLPLALQTLDEAREEVLYSWETGNATRDISANAKRLAAGSALAARQRTAERENELLLQPRAGVSDHSRQKDLFNALRGAGADVLSLQIDSLTRNNRYEEIGQILKQAGKSSQPLDTVLNGYPAVNYGVERLAELSREFSDVPLQVRHSTKDPRLLAELTYAGGISAFEGGAISYNLPYYRDYPLALAIERWRYVDSLTARYVQEFGIVIDREFFGVLTACLVPPAIAIVTNVFEALLAAEQGVKSVTLGYGEQGNRTQDLAAVRVLHDAARHYLDDHGHDDVAVSVVWHQYMGPFPKSADKAQQMLVGSTETAAMSQAVRMMLKSTAEAKVIPSAADNAQSLQTARLVTDRIKTGAKKSLGPADRDEERLLTNEVHSIVDAALNAADGKIGRAVELAVLKGWLDVPFSPSRWNAGLIMPIRDLQGAVRVASLGNLPWSGEVADAHAASVACRVARDGDRIEELIERDIAVTAEGDFDSWPLGQ